MAPPTCKPTCTAAAYEVPEWAVKNKEIFLSAARKARVAPPPGMERMPALPSWSSFAAAEDNAAMSMSVLAAEVKNGILPPTRPPASDYFRNVANHPDVLSTIIATARYTVGFEPQLNGANLTVAEAQAYLDKFNAFLDELGLYYVYLHMIKGGFNTIENNSIDCAAMLRSISAVVASALGVATSGSGYEKLVQSISNLVIAAVNAVSSQGRSTSASFEMLGLPASNVEGEEPSRNPISAVTFTTTRLYRQKSGKSTVEESYLMIAAYSYQLVSSAVIEYAEDLAGATMTGTTDLRAFINAPLKALK